MNWMSTHNRPLPDHSKNICPVLLLVRVFSVLMLMYCAPLSHAAVLTAIDADTKSSQVSVSFRFDEEVRYTVQMSEDGKSLMIRANDTVPAQGLADNTLISGNALVRGWGMRTVGGVLEVELLLSGRCSYAHNVIESPFTIQVDVYGNAGEASQSAPVRPGRISHGIELFQEGRFDEALSEFNDEVSANPRSPLSYYYAARIRLEKNQYARAEKNLQAALRDSVDFTDARGFLAFTRMKMKKTSLALSDWQKFVNDVGRIDSGEVSADDIILPENYRTLIAEEKRRREEEAARTAAEARRDSLEAVERAKAAEKSNNSEKEVDDSVTTADTSGQPAVPPIENVGGDIERRMRRNITYGLIGLVVSGILLVCGVAGVTVWIKRRMAPTEEVTFAREVANLIEAEEVSDEEFERKEERAIREYEMNNRAIRHRETDYTTGNGRNVEERPAPLPERLLENRLPAAPVTDRSHAITEEVKALVMKMHREGRSVAEIASTADLTRTEVELILAVRARHVERLVSEAASEAGEDIVADHMFRAVEEMYSEGRTVRDIARKLNISTSEVQLAVSLLNMYRPRQL